MVLLIRVQRVVCYSRRQDFLFRSVRLRRVVGRIANYIWDCTYCGFLKRSFHYYDRNNSPPLNQSRKKITEYADSKAVCGSSRVARPSRAGQVQHGRQSVGGHGTRTEGGGLLFVLQQSSK